MHTSRKERIEHAAGELHVAVREVLREKGERRYLVDRAARARLVKAILRFAHVIGGDPEPAEPSAQA